MHADAHFILEAYIAAIRSKDKRTQVGACIVDPDGVIRSKGYNGPCRGENDNDDSIYEKPFKTLLFEHAERNAIYNLARVGVSGIGCRMYATKHPCVECARGIIQSGIAEIILHKQAPNALTLDHSQQQAATLLARIGLPVRWWSGKIPSLNILDDSVSYPFCDDS